jgi:tetratricopeptide (TPR) repeat protein
MLTEDYLSRIISQAVAALLEALGLRKSGRFKEALQVIHAALEGLFGVPVRLLLQMEHNSMLDVLAKEGKLDVNRAVVAADLFREAGEIESEMNRSSEASVSYSQALVLYLDVAFADEDTRSPELDQTIIAHHRKLNGSLTQETAYALFYYYQETDNHSGAISALDELMDDAHRELTIMEEAVEYYRALLQAPDDLLIYAGISKQDVEYRLENLTNQLARE